MNDEFVTLIEAGKRLGLTADAVDKRLRRGGLLTPADVRLDGRTRLIRWSVLTDKPTNVSELMAEAVADLEYQNAELRRDLEARLSELSDKLSETEKRLNQAITREQTRAREVEDGIVQELRQREPAEEPRRAPARPGAGNVPFVGLAGLLRR